MLHNPRSDRRTTKGTFHVSEGGLPIPGDKKAVPRPVFVALFRQALCPPAELLVVPLTSTRADPVRAFVSLLLRPVVCPEVPGVGPEKTMEVRFFAPGGLVSNLDFVESIFGNAGDPNLPENDAGLDVEHWTGHTGCVILAPHLTRLTKKELGLPAWDDATERQRHDGMCWRDPGEAYNDGQAFKVTCRDASGVIVTLIADNYYGYCKKEVKTQISLRRQPVRQRGRGARRRCAGLPALQPGRRVRRRGLPDDRPHASPTWPVRIPRRSTSGPRGTASIRAAPTWSTSRTTPAPACPGCRCGGRRTVERSPYPCGPARRT